jgi:glycerophosphoryl diester phosphodiesterase
VHAAGLQDWRRLIAAEVDAIITDNPTALLACLREIGLR